MEWKFIRNINSEEATILLYNQIGSSIDGFGNYDQGIDGSLFAEEMKYLDKAGLKKINVRINSVGGSVIHGYSIVSAILNCATPVETYVDGLAASMAGVVAVAGKKCYMMDYGMLMLHNPSGCDDKNVLNLIKSTLVTIFKNRTTLDEEQVNKMMDRETWLDATEAMKMGLVDEIVSSGKKVKVQKSDSLKSLALVYNKIINPVNKMEKIINALKLNVDATEETVVETFNSLNEKISTLEKENEALKLADVENKKIIDAIETEKKEAKAKQIEDMVNSYGLKDEEKEKAVKLAEVDFDAVKNMLEKSKVVAPAKITDVINKDKSKGENRDSWTMRDWEKKDPKGLEKMHNETPELFNELYKKTYDIK